MTCRNSKRWSRNNDQCISCGTTAIRHAGHGLCKRCYARMQYAKKHNIALVPPGERRWSRKHDACVSCGTTAVPHVAHGLCTACYLKQHYHTRVDYIPRKGWSRKWEACQICGTTSYKHAGYGICRACKSRAKWFGMNNPVYKELLAIREEAVWRKIGVTI